MSLRSERRGREDEVHSLLVLIADCSVIQVISRRLHKFFNIGELPETEPEKIDINRPHIILEKMDGYVPFSGILDEVSA